MPLLAKLTFVQGLMALTLFLVCILLMLVVLIQKGRGGGLAAAFGGGGGGGAFGTKTGDVFTWITVVLAGVFLLMTVLGNYVFIPLTVVTAGPPAVSPASGGAGGAGGSGLPPAGAVPAKQSSGDQTDSGDDAAKADDAGKSVETGLSGESGFSTHTYGLDKPKPTAAPAPAGAGGDASDADLSATDPPEEAAADDAGEDSKSHE